MVIFHGAGASLYNLSVMLSRARGVRLLRRSVRAIVAAYVLLLLVLSVLHYPRDTDRSYDPRASTGSSTFYEAAYSVNKNRGSDYEAVARRAAEESHIAEGVQDFVRQYGISDKRVLEVGSGRGYLQDIVDDYTGLDISNSVAGHYHKRFVQGSATAMPFKDSSYDVIWTIWVLEHIPEPEKALNEMRRVLRPGGILLLVPAWECTPLAAGGFNVRPASDFNAFGKLVKATVPLYPKYASATSLPIRIGRWFQYAAGGTTLHYRRLRPNYDVYWQPDSDAAVSLDRFEVYRWFLAHGDECLNCGSPIEELCRHDGAFFLRIVKPDR